MGENTKIEWATHTWNPFYGCPDDGKRSPACDNCYASSWAKRSGIVDFDHEIKRAAKATFLKPLNKKIYKPGDSVFVCSLSDFFHEDVPVELYQEIYSEVIMKRPDLTWIFLTKRPENINYDNWMFDDTPDNFWLGVTVENQEQVYCRVPELLKIPASVRFLSVEPMLSSINLGYFAFDSFLKKINWVICGGETGQSKYARRMDKEWVLMLRDQCANARIPFLFKKWGAGNNSGLIDGVEYLQFPETKNV